MFRDDLIKALNQLQEKGILVHEISFQDVTVEPPKDPTHGDVATNAALVLAKKAKKNPLEIARALQEALLPHPHITHTQIAGPGFLNITLSPSYWQEGLADLLQKGSSYGSSSIGANMPLNIEYVSANPTGPLHAGHGRPAVVADVIANLLEKIGFDVTREYYLNDTGGQIDVLARSTWLRYKEALGQTIGQIPEGYYPGDYLKDVALALIAEKGDAFLGQSEEDVLPDLGRFATDYLMQDIHQDLDLIGIHQDVFVSELELHTTGAVEHAVGLLADKGLVHEGVLDKPKSQALEDWAPTPLMLFKSTLFGDSSDRPLKKTSGEWTYLAGDIAYHQHKIERGFPRLINVWGADHASHVDRVQAAVKALGDNRSQLEILLVQMVHFVKDGEPLKMSKRAGSFVTVRDVVDQIGADVFRFLMVSRKHDSQFTLDLNQALEQSKDNPVFYVQYAHARACSVLRMGEVLFPQLSIDGITLSTAALGLLTDEAELCLIKALTDWPRQVEKAAQMREPHRIVTFLYELAHRFHTLWNKGKKETWLRFLVPDDKDLSTARLALLQGVIIVIASGLNILGVKALKEMR